MPNFGMLEVALVREGVLHIQPDQFAPEKQATDPVTHTEGAVYPDNADDLCEMYAGIQGLPVGAKIDKIEFYAYNTDAQASIEFKMYYMVSYVSGWPTPQSIENSGVQTGGPGNLNWTWTPDPAHEVLEDNPIHISVFMTGKPAGSNILFKGCSVFYTY